MGELTGAVISFDLKMSLLDIYFEGGSKNRSNAYGIIRKFLMSKGYEPLDDSDYKNNEHSINMAMNALKELCSLEKN